MKKVSVVIPFYSRTYVDLDKTIQSVFEQDYKNIQVIIVDDFSPILAEDCIKKYANSTNLKVVRNTVNLGGGLSRNIGVNHADGELVAFLDHDDFWYTYKISKQIKIYNQTDNNSMAVVYSQCNIISENESFVMPKKAIHNNRSVSNYLFTDHGLIQTSGILLEKSLALKVPFDDLKRHQDYQFCLSLERFGANFFMVEEPLYDFIQTPKLNDYSFSIFWINKYKHFFSDSAAFSFKQDVILRSMISHHKHFKRAFVYAFENKMLLAFAKYFSVSLIKKLMPVQITTWLQSFTRR